MAMLAERRHKQKWSLNPRGKEWSQDTNKFGQKMLEKMGWKSGKGLGAKLDGMTEHVKLSHKHDSKGMGYKETEQWTQHDENFTKLLNSLADNSSGVELADSVPESLEQISANSKKRVHYHKFTRGKDLSQYSEKQLANIFGKKTLKPKESEDSTKETNNKNSKKYGVQTLEGGSMVDYFKNKLGGKFATRGAISGGFEIGNNGVLQKSKIDRKLDCESEMPSFGFGFQKNISEPNLESLEIENVSKKSKKRKLTKENVDEVYDNAIFNVSLNDSKEMSQENIVENPFEIKHRKKKIKTDLSSENFDFHESKKIKKKSKKSDIDSTMNSDVRDVITEEKVGKIKKNKKNKITPLNDVETINITSTKLKKKKSKKNPQTEENVSGNVADLENTSISDSSQLTNVETPVKKTKKNKLNKSISDTTIDSVETSTKKKSKKSKNFGFENPNFDINDSTLSLGDVTSEFEVRRKKKKKNKKSEEISGLDNPGLNVSTLTEVLDDSYQEGLSISLQQNLFNGIENLALNISKNDSYISDVIECDLMLNVATLPSSAQKKQIERTKNVRFSSINQQYIIPNNYENKLIQQKFEGLANAAFDERAATMEENMMEIEQQLSTDCAKVENDLNEVRAAAHARLFVPIIPTDSNVTICHGNAGVRSLPVIKGASGGGTVKKNTGAVEREADFPEIGEKDSAEVNEATPSGDVRLSYKLASLNVTNIPAHLRKVPKNTDRASYKHLVKGDVILEFKKSNLHEISGYGSEEIVLNNTK